MGTLVDNNEDKRDLDDSGCVQDDSSQKMAETVENGVNLLDLSDDVLLYILRHCSPRDLKALGYSCARLGRLVRERSLWRRVDARSEPCSLARLKWYITHALHADTRHLYIRGYAAESRGCRGLLNCSRKDAEDEQKNFQEKKNSFEQAAKPSPPIRMHNIQRHHACLYISAHASSRLPRPRGSPLWPEEDGWGRAGCTGGVRCGGPQFSVSEPLLRQLRDRCARLTRLVLERCNINCNTTNLSHLPPTLTRLSLCGTKCFNLPIDKSFLFKIQDHLPLLESLDVSECDWLEPTALLPLSKHSKLKELYMRDCHRMTEFVAYASLSSRYGFRQLQILDFRGSPVGDSEVAPLAWLPELRQLKLSAAVKPPAAMHAHYADDKRVLHSQLDDWEMQVPEYFQEPVPDPVARMNFDNNGSLPSDGNNGSSDDDDGSSDDDDNDNDDMDDNAGRVVQPDHNEMVPNEGESSKTGRDTTITKRKAENGSGDASVNGQSTSKRKKNDVRDRKRPSSRNSEGSEDDRYDKRRCQTIVILNRRPYSNESDDEDDPRLHRLPGPFGREQGNRGLNNPSTSGTSNSTQKSNAENDKRDDKDESKRVDENDMVGVKKDEEEMGKNQSDTTESNEDCKPKVDEKVNVGASTSGNVFANNEDKTDSNTLNNNNANAGASKDILVFIDGGGTFRDSTVYNNGASTSRNEVPIVGASTSRNDVPNVGASTSRNDVPNVGASTSRNDVPNVGANTSRNDVPNVGANTSRNDVPNVGASTSKDTSAPDQVNAINEDASTSKDKVTNDNETATTSSDNATNNSERYVCFRQGQQPVVVNMSNDLIIRPGHATELSRRVRTNFELEVGRNFLDAEHPNIHHYNYHVHQDDNYRVINFEFGSRGNMNVRPAEPQNQRAPENNNDARRSLVDRNPRIMNLIRNVDFNNVPDPMFPPVPQMHPDNPPLLQNLASTYSPVRNADFANLPTQEDNREREPRHRVLYVNVGQPANSIGPLPNVIQGLENRILNFRRSHADPASLLTDSTIRRFGRAASNDIRFVLVGIPHPFLGPNYDASSRPERSNLEVLVVNGYRTITDRSLVHLSTAAPFLRFLDCRETNVTAQGVENFRSLRPDCEVLFSPYVERDVVWPEEED